jgi:NAD(P)-dependent dehydrogenase (short-subunit alcohol dehydrogenase family)
VVLRFGWGETWEEIERDATKNLVSNDTRRLGSVEEIASAVSFIASPLASYISGTVIRVDGRTIRYVG